MKIEYLKDKTIYYDMNGEEIHAGDYVMLNGRKEKVYLCSDEVTLGVDATNPKWLESGRACACEYGIYPFTTDDEPVLVGEIS